MRAHQLRSSSPRRQRTRSQLGHAFTAATLPAASSLSSRHGAPQPPTAEETASVRYGRAQRYDGTRRRVPRPAALSTAREAQSMRSITGGKQPRESSSLIMRAPPRVQRLALAPHHDGATAESRDAERGSPFPRPSGWTAADESDVESVTSNGDFGPTRLTIATRACVADDRSGPRSLC